jgi:hypothetical protein
MEKGLALSALERSIREFLATMDGVTPELYLVSPGPGRWTLAENAEHVTVVIRGVERLLSTRLLQQPIDAGDPSGRMQDADLPRLLADRSRAIDAPDLVRPKGRWTAREEMAAALEATTAGIVAWAGQTSADLRAFGARHPILGPLDGMQWLQFLSVHTDRHARQAEEIRTAVSGER